MVEVLAALGGGDDRIRAIVRQQRTKRQPLAAVQHLWCIQRSIGGLCLRPHLEALLRGGQKAEFVPGQAGADAPTGVGRHVRRDAFRCAAFNRHAHPMPDLAAVAVVAMIVDKAAVRADAAEDHARGGVGQLTQFAVVDIPGMKLEDARFVRRGQAACRIAGGDLCGRHDGRTIPCLPGSLGGEVERVHKVSKDHSGFKSFWLLYGLSENMLFVRTRHASSLHKITRSEHAP
ncbi:hypothetical protein HC928_20460 [bacterium]|nr:hypothetical protein [bacterium]